MELDIVQIINFGLAAIGVATIGLNIIAPLTKTKKDDKVLKVLKRVLEVVSLNVDKDKSVLKIKIPKK